MPTVKPEQLPTRHLPLGVKEEPAEVKSPGERLSRTPLEHAPLSPYHLPHATLGGPLVAPHLATKMEEKPIVKAEEGDFHHFSDNEPAIEHDSEHQEPSQAPVNWADNPPNFANNAPINSLEQEAICQLFEMPVAEIPPSERRKEPAALKKRLMPHQRVGLTWLIRQEQSKLKGGILADDMGLGKTIQALALILARPPEDGIRKTTLVVVPTALLRQWEQEIDDKVKPGHKLKTVIYHGQKKRGVTVTNLLSHDVVFTTYGTLAHEYKFIYEKKKNARAVLLAPNAIFHRVILDEAHNIKNRNSLSFRAVARLRSTYRLCMTGTPLMNRLDELYPLVSFLRIEPHCQWDTFRGLVRGVKNGSPGSMRQVQALLSRIMLRRTENTMVDGQPILTLPSLTIETVQAVFDQDQLDYYQSLEQRSQLTMNRYLKERSVGRHYWHILILILRLRQCCCHPYLLKDHTIPQGVDMTPEEMNKLAGKLPPQHVARILGQKSFECPMCMQEIERPVFIHPCLHHICGNCLTNMISVSDPGAELEGEDGGDGGAPMGRCPHENCTKVIDSKSVICYKNIVENWELDDDDEDEIEDEEEDEEEDADENGDLRDFIVSDEHESEDEVDDDDDGKDDEDIEVEDDQSTTLKESPFVDSLDGDSKPDSPLQDPEEPQDDEGVKREKNVDGDGDCDSDDSLPPIESFFTHLKKEEAQPSAIKDFPDAVQNKRSNKRPLESDSDGDVAKASTSGKKRKGSGKGGAGSKKDSKTDMKTESKTDNKKKKKSKTDKGKGTALTLGALKKSSLSSARARERYFDSLRKDWETSCKVDSAMEILSRIRRDHPNEKTLVFSQFTSFLDLIEIPISDDGYNYRRYDGSMSTRDRGEAVHEFMTKPEVKVMLVSLRCGNAGLNLYAATRVIMLDPFWNPSVEDQAIKRAHRLGQTRPVVAYRVLVQETIEDRILALQEKKRELVNNVLDPEARGRVSTLSASELAGLFGIHWTG
ncbi:hypothetical protein F5Y17DRAFT_436767 [Xylariaceae sp. FL0594]|nr:hypothetical protein F5Y17DRAFT_436767 [Xylariaceae sp. FL0594]